MDNQLPEPPREVHHTEHVRVKFIVKDGKVDDASPYFVFLSVEVRGKIEPGFAEVANRMGVWLKPGSSREDAQALADDLNEKVASLSLLTSTAVAPGREN